MNTQQIKNLLYTIYSAGFEHGANEGSFPTHGTFEAFNRLLIGESPREDDVSYSIKEKVEKLISLGDVIKNEVAVCSCNELPNGEIAISSKALQKPYGDLGQTVL